MFLRVGGKKIIEINDKEISDVLSKCEKHWKDFKPDSPNFYGLSFGDYYRLIKYINKVLEILRKSTLLKQGK